MIKITKLMLTFSIMIFKIAIFLKLSLNSQAWCRITIRNITYSPCYIGN